MSELPESWAEVRLGEVVDYGATIKVEPGDIGDDAWILELEDIEKDSSQVVQRYTFAQRKSKSTKNRFEKGDVLYGKLRPYLNKVVVATSGGYCTTEIIPIKQTPATDNRFVFHWLKHPAFVAYASEVSHGLNMPRLGTEAGKNAPFVLAPIAEQKRIADKLDALLARVDAARARLDRVPALLKRFRQSVLAAATSGVLTEDWRGVNASQPATECTVDDLSLSTFDGPFGSNLKSDDYTESGVRVVRLENIGWMTFHEDRQTFVSEEKFESLTRHTLRAEDVVVSSFVDEDVRVCLIPDDLDGRAINKADCFCVRVNVEVCLPKYLMLRLACRSTYEEFSESVHGATRPRINLRQLKGFVLNLPRIEEQHEIIRRVEALFVLADKVQAQYAAARARIDRLTPALLAKAFRGELVPQDPKDEPASVLLERIRAERTAAPKPARQSRRTRTEKKAG